MKDYWKECPLRNKKNAGVDLKLCSWRGCEQEMVDDVVRKEGDTSNPALRVNTSVVWYMITPTGRVSKYWYAYTWRGTSYPMGVTQNMVDKTFNAQKICKLPKGYKWSEPYLYSGNIVPKDKLMVVNTVAQVLRVGNRQFDMSVAQIDKSTCCYKRRWNEETINTIREIYEQ